MGLPKLDTSERSKTTQNLANYSAGTHMSIRSMITSIEIVVGGDKDGGEQRVEEDN